MRILNKIVVSDVNGNTYEVEEKEISSALNSSSYSGLHYSCASEFLKSATIEDRELLLQAISFSRKYQSRNRDFLHSTKS